MIKPSSSLKLFFSADMIGSTALKEHSAISGLKKLSDESDWTAAFSGFYEDFTTIFRGHCKQNEKCEGEPIFWKGIGDELLFYIELFDQHHARSYLRGFQFAIDHFNNDLLTNKSYKVKGTAWIAGFPVMNREVNLPAKNSVLIDANNESAGRKHMGDDVDFLGGSIDIGFRIGRFSSASKLVISVDLAYLLLAVDGARTGFDFYFDGLESLKGVFGGKPYPIIWLKTFNRKDDRLSKLIGVDKRECDADMLTAYCKEYIEGCKGALILPYIVNDGKTVFGEVPEPHQKYLEQKINEHAERQKKLNEEARFAVGNGGTIDASLLSRIKDTSPDAAGPAEHGADASEKA